MVKYNKNLLKIKKYCSLAELSKSPASIANIRLTRKTWHAILFGFADIYPTKSPHAYCSMRRFSLQLELLLFKRFFYLLYFRYFIISCLFADFCFLKVLFQCSQRFRFHLLRNCNFHLRRSTLECIPANFHDFCSLESYA